MTKKPAEMSFVICGITEQMRIPSRQVTLILISYETVTFDRYIEKPEKRSFYINMLGNKIR
ncbi:hypothetical protein BMS3Abin06_01774 [bacterium BMS3Abin06]|nr:hypothetical protein BMS3Abin06_01774 [bacterium BMS3Abin06]